jgi:hypothetical protein
MLFWKTVWDGSKREFAGVRGVSALNLGYVVAVRLSALHYGSLAEITDNLSTSIEVFATFTTKLWQLYFCSHVICMRQHMCQSMLPSLCRLQHYQLTQEKKSTAWMHDSNHLKDIRAQVIAAANASCTFVLRSEYICHTCCQCIMHICMKK